MSTNAHYNSQMVANMIYPLKGSKGLFTGQFG